MASIRLGAQAPPPRGHGHARVAAGGRNGASGAGAPPARAALVGGRAAARGILALDKAGLRFAVEPFGWPRVEGRFTPRGDEWAELLVGDLPAAEGATRFALPDGPSVARQLGWRTCSTVSGH